MRHRIEMFIWSSLVIAATVIVTVGSGAAGVDRAAALGASGPATVVQSGTDTPIESGGGGSGFSLRLPAGDATCPGDTGSGGYYIQSFIVPAGVDPSTLTYDTSGPVPNGVGADVRQPLYLPNTTGFVNASTGAATSAGGPGDIPTLPPFSFGVYGSSALDYVPAGVYNIGLACTLNNNTVKYWVTQIEIVADTGDSTGIGWLVPEGSGPTTTTSTTTTVVGSPTTSTTTTVVGGTTTSTTVVGGSTTTSTTVAGSNGLGNVPVGGTVTVSGSGFAAGESVKIFLRSDPVLLTTVQASSTGQVSATVTIPSGTATGAHQIELVGQTSAHTVTLNVTVVAASTTTTTTTATGSGSGSGSAAGSGSGGVPLASTGSSSWPIAAWAVLLLALGRMAYLVSRHPRIVTTER